MGVCGRGILFSCCLSIYLSAHYILVSDWLKIRSGHGILIYSAWQGLRLSNMFFFFLTCNMR